MQGSIWRFGKAPLPCIWPRISRRSAVVPASPSLISRNPIPRALRAPAALCAALLPLAAPTAAHANSAAASYFASRADRSAMPHLLSEDERGFYRDLFAAIHRQDWTAAQTLLAQKADGPLHGIATGEIVLGGGAPTMAPDALAAWLSANAALPEAEPIAQLATRHGAANLPALPAAQTLIALPPAPHRTRPREITDGSMPPPVAAAMAVAIKADNPGQAKLLLDGVDAVLSADARAEWRQKVAWSYYIENDDAAAFSMGLAAGDGTGAIPERDGSISAPTTGPWATEGWWVAGLAAWRSGDCANAEASFARTAADATNPELTAAALFWQARSAVRCRQPDAAAAALRTAASFDETLYGMLAAEQLGLVLPATHAAPDFTAADWQALRDIPNIRTAVALAEVGEDALADEVLRHQARIGDPALYQPLSRLSRDLGLPAAQLWMAYNVPAGAAPAPASRYPMPKWTPTSGWQVDPALLLADTLQESQFHAGVVSPAGARGLMQIMPSAARQHAAELGFAGTVADLTRPSVNMAFGQAHMQSLRDAPATGGLLLKVIAAYNAGILPVARWNQQIHDGGDPLLWMESVPYWETRGYVATVIRNYWMYERQAGGPSESRQALAQGLWPTFPGLVGGTAVRLALNTPAAPLKDAGQTLRNPEIAY